MRINVTFSSDLVAYRVWVRRARVETKLHSSSELYVSPSIILA